MFPIPFFVRLFAMISIIVFPFVALAQSSEIVKAVHLDGLINEIVPYLMALCSAIITAAVAWAAKKLSDWTGITIEARHREAFQSALSNGAQVVIDRYKPTDVKFNVSNQHLRSGVQFVIDSVPDAVAFFGLGAADIERHLKPKVSKLIGLEPGEMAASR